MNNFFEIVLDFIIIDLLIGFGWYSMVFFVLKLTSYKKEILNKFDIYACRATTFLGVFLGVFLISASFLNYFVEMDEEQKAQFVQRLTGKYSFGLWLQPLFWVVLTQMLRIRLVRRFLIFRLFISISFILTFEHFVIFFTSFHRDYLPSSWNMIGISWWQLVLSAVIKIIEFVLIVLIYKYVKNQKSND